MIINRLNSKLHRNTKGFTMAEVLITVAIIVILLGLATPAVVNYQRKLKKMELDRTAEEIYLSVQNSFSNIRLNNTLSVAMKNADGKYEKIPSDYVGSQDFDKLKFHSLFSASSSLYDEYLETMSLKSLGMDFAVEYIESGNVYSVFYTEDSKIKPIISNAAKSGNCTELDQYRSNEKVGYYTTRTFEDSVFTEKERIDLTVSPVFDGDILSVDLIVENGSDFAATKSDLTYTVKYSDGITEKLITYTGEKAELDSSGNLVLHLIFDSFGTGEDVHFYSSDLGNGFSVGSSILMTVDNVVYKSGDKIAAMSLDKPKTVEFHPSFDQASSGTNILLSCERHLNNLRSDYFSVDEGGYQITQLCNLDVSKLSQFGPVSNDLLFRDGTVYNGQMNEITGLQITGSAGSSAGLFGSLACKVQNLFIINPVVNASADYVGALCGYLDGGEVYNCGVRCDADNYPSCIVSGGSLTGGLIGLANNSVITESYAAVDVIGNGGFAGKLDSCTVEHCYSSGIVDARTLSSPSGGFASNISGTVSNCYTTSDVKCRADFGHCGGFSYSVNGVSNCISYGRVYDGSNEYYGFDYMNPVTSDILDRLEVGGFAATGNCDSCCFLIMPGYNQFLENGIGEEYAGGYVSDKSKIGRRAYYYTNSLHGHVNQYGDCIFPLDDLGIRINDHYGDWPHYYVVEDVKDDINHTYRCACCNNTHSQEHLFPDLQCIVCDYIRG